MRRLIGRFVEYREDQFLRLARFDDYVSRTDAPNYQGGAKTAYLDEIIFWIVPESTTRIAGLESGDYDIITEVPDTEYKRLSASSDALTFTCTPPGSGVRIGLDRDLDGFYDGDELAAGSDPANPLSTP